MNTQYLQQLQQKQQFLQDLLSDFYTDEITLFASPEKHFRMRAEFRIWREGGEAFYAMFEQGQKNKPILLTQFAVASEQINSLMIALKKAWQQHPLLLDKLFQVDFLSTLSGQALITLCYHRHLDDEWLQLAKQLESELGAKIIGRAKKQKLVCSDDYVVEELSILAKTYRYQQPENSFTQPNAVVNQEMITWACEQLNNQEGDLQDGDLLELYCGNGNFTLPFCHHVRKVLATEISKSSIRALENNIVLNQIDNLQIARLSAEELTQALNNVRPFRRLAHINLSEYDFKTVFVDPPRAGVDVDTCQLLSRFQRIVYISCNPHTLAENLQQLSHTHIVKACALFDQFPYTKHIETGVVLEKLAK